MVEVPLSHLDPKPGKQTAQNKTRLTVGLAATGLLVLVGVLIWEPNTSPTNAVLKSEPETAPDTRRQTSATKPEFAPFESIARNQADQIARQTINAYMELEKQINNEVFIPSSDEIKLSQIEQKALEGDRLYYQGDFEAALAQYEIARSDLAALLGNARSKFAEQIVQAKAQLLELNIDPAKASITAALAIMPNSKEAKEVAARVAALPKIIDLLRTAKNYDLGERHEKSLPIYRQIKLTDPLTLGIDSLIGEAETAIRENQIQKSLTLGFALLDNKDFEPARKAFQKALKLDSSNQTALAGLEQIALYKDLFIINTKTTVGENALKEGQWQEAELAYDQVLAIDPNIQGAIRGKNQASNHERLERLLSKITSEPFKLSSEKLFLEAKVILADSQKLSFKTEKLSQLIRNTSELIVLYAQPVNLTLLSDEATEVIISNVGRLGKFSKKVITVRPGRYTIRGSQTGCKDIYRTVDVLPDLEPIIVSCQERFN